MRLAWCAAGPPGHQTSNVVGDYRRIVAELVIAAVQAANRRLWDRARVQVDMCDRHGFVVTAVIEIDRHAARKLPAEVIRRREIRALPAAAAYEGSRDQA